MFYYLEYQYIMYCVPTILISKLFIQLQFMNKHDKSDSVLLHNVLIYYLLCSHFTHL